MSPRNLKVRETENGSRRGVKKGFLRSSTNSDSWHASAGTVTVTVTV